MPSMAAEPGSAPEVFETARLLLRPPRRADAEAIFARYASDPEVTRHLSFATHRSLDDTAAFLDYSEVRWAQWPAGPYLAFTREELVLLGGTGLRFETPHRAEVGYALARDAWGVGYATEILGAMVELGSRVGVWRLHAYTHPEQAASQRVLEKCGFELEGTLRRHSVFPNLEPDAPQDVLVYAKILKE